MRVYLEKTLPLIALAMLIGAAVIAACNATIVYNTGLPLADMWREESLGQTIQIATPFFVYALFGIRKRGPWIVALLLTLAAWGLLYLPHAATIGGGVNLGWAFLSIFLPIAIFCGGMLALMPNAARGE